MLKRSPQTRRLQIGVNWRDGGASPECADSLRALRLQLSATLDNSAILRETKFALNCCTIGNGTTLPVSSLSISFEMLSGDAQLAPHLL